MAFDDKHPLFRFYEEVINQRKLHVLDEIFSENYINCIAPKGIENNATGVKRLISEQTKAFPDWHIQVDYFFEIGNKIIVKWTLTGTHQEEYFGIKPKGLPFKMTGVDIETIINGKIAEHDGAEDMLSLYQQIGAVGT